MDWVNCEANVTAGSTPLMWDRKVLEKIKF